MMRKSALILAILLTLAVSTGVQAALHLDTYLGLSINTFSPNSDMFAPVAPGVNGGVRFWITDMLALGSEVEYLNTASDIFGVKNVSEGTSFLGTVSVRVYKGFQLYAASGYCTFKSTSSVYGQEHSHSHNRMVTKTGLEYAQGITENLYLSARVGYRFADAYMGERHPGFTGIETGLTVSLRF